MSNFETSALFFLSFVIAVVFFYLRKDINQKFDTNFDRLNTRLDQVFSLPLPKINSFSK